MSLLASIVEFVLDGFMWFPQVADRWSRAACSDPNMPVIGCRHQNFADFAVFFYWLVVLMALVGALFFYPLRGVLSKLRSEPEAVEPVSMLSPKKRD